MRHDDRNHERWHPWESSEPEDFAPQRPVSPGKRTLTMSLPPQSAAAAAPVQWRRDPRKAEARAEHPDLTDQWLNVAMRPDVHAVPVQRKSAGPERDEEHRSPTDGSGQPMPEDVQAKMEGAFGTDFSAVRVHQGSQAEAMGALAYTQGTDIHFAPGQYDPGSQRGQELLGHELTHVVQQSQGRVRATTQARGMGLNDDASLEWEADDMGARAALGAQRDSAVDTRAIPLKNDARTVQRQVANEPDGYKELRERASKEKQQGNSELSDALDVALMKPIAFEFSSLLIGETPIIIPHDGGGLHVRLESTVTSTREEGDSTGKQDSEKGQSVKSVEQYTLSLSKGNLSPQQISAEGISSITWEGLEAGVYKLIFSREDGGESILIKGVAAVEVLSGPGEQPRAGKHEDEFELKTGFKTGTTSARGVTFGQYVLRSEPVKQSFIFGTLPGPPTQVKVVDKKSYDREGGNTWYKIQFEDKEAFEKLAIVRPPEVNPTAHQMYEQRSAWITDVGLKVYLPYEKFIAFVRVYENDTSIAKLSMKERITKLRQLYAESKLKSDDILGTEPGEKGVDDRPSLSGLYQMLKKADTGVILPDGSLVDAGHVILSLDAYNHEDKETSVYAIPSGTRHVVATWGGDTGAAVGNYMMEHVKRGLHSIDETLLDKHFERSATNDDLWGNIDGIGMSQLQHKEGKSATTIEQLLDMFYRGESQGGGGRTLTENRALGLQTLLVSQNFESPENLLGQASGVASVYEETVKFGWIWFLQNQGILGSFVSAMKFKHEEHHQLLREVSMEVTQRFLARLEVYANNLGLTK